MFSLIAFLFSHRPQAKVYLQKYKEIFSGGFERVYVRTGNSFEEKNFFRFLRILHVTMIGSQ